VPEDNDKIKKLSFSVRASELAEMGIDLTAKDTTELAQVGIKKKRFFFADLSLPPLSLTEARGSRLASYAPPPISSLSKRRTLQCARTCASSA